MTRIVDPDLHSLREMVLRMGTLAEAILAKSLRAVWERDAKLEPEIRADDLEIDRMDVAIDQAVLRLLALHAPVAKDLRQVIASKTIATDLERVGDLARNIAKSAARLAERPDIELPPSIQKLADESQRILRHALDSFSSTDAALARRVVQEDDQIDADEDRIVRQAIEEIRRHPETVAQEVDLILIAKNLERVADHATNIAEDVVLIAEAENLKHAEKLATGVETVTPR
ncbi:MAG: phosphate signaling complex protein PhoU [Proteobacteria bacterium]|nr:phosphate signaling complex protein PhoU [Pseudomonadota bacterium]